MELWESKIQSLRDNLVYKKDEKKLIHNFGKGVNIVPVNTQKYRLGEAFGMTSIIGEFSRIISNETLKNELNLEKISEEIISQEIFDSNSKDLKEEFGIIINGIKSSF